MIYHNFQYVQYQMKILEDLFLVSVVEDNLVLMWIQLVSVEEHWVDLHQNKDPEFVSSLIHRVYQIHWLVSDIDSHLLYQIQGHLKV